MNFWQRNSHQLGLDSSVLASHNEGLIGALQEPRMLGNLQSHPLSGLSVFGVVILDPIADVLFAQQESVKKSVIHFRKNLRIIYIFVTY